MVRIISLGLLAALAGGCEDDVGEGTVEVSWRVGGRTCVEAGVSEVRVELYDFSGPAPVRTLIAPCAVGAARVGGVPVGQYALVLRGLAENGCWTHEVRYDDLRVGSDALATVDELRLARRGRTLEVSWPFANDLSCGDNGVEQVVVEVIVNGVVARRVPYLCADGPALVPDVRTGALRVSIAGYDRAGNAIVEGDASLAPDLLTSDCRDVIPFEVPLTVCLETGC